MQIWQKQNVFTFSLRRLCRDRGGLAEPCFFAFELNGMLLSQK